MKMMMFCYVTSYRWYQCFRGSCTVTLKFTPEVGLTGYFKMLETSYKTPRYRILECQLQILLHTILISNSERIIWDICLHICGWIILNFILKILKELKLFSVGSLVCVSKHGKQPLSSIKGG